MIDISTGKHFDKPSNAALLTRRIFGKGLAAVIAAGCAPAILSASTGRARRGLGMRMGMMGGSIRPAPVCFTANTAGSTLYLLKVGTPPTVTLEYSTDGESWQTFITSATASECTTITLANVGDFVYLRAGSGGNTKFASSTSAYHNFVMTGSISASGNIQSLLDATLGRTDVGGYCYNYMFYGCTSLTTAPALPATTLATACYYSMFYGCTSLTTAPALPATTLASACYNYMFYGCTSLTTAPELPATTLASSCYGSMFNGCTSLTTAPELPSTTLATSCYNHMFYGCTSLTTAPELPATTLANNCYYYMFYGCTSLTTAPALPATTLASACYNYMFYGCTSLTTAPALPATALATSCYNYMFYGCTSLTTAPALPATTLANYCYCYMFQSCTSLTTAPALPATTLASACYYSMFYGCTSLKISANGGVGNIILNVPSGTTEPSGWNTNMFRYTGGSFTGSPSVGVPYYNYT